MECKERIGRNEQPALTLSQWMPHFLIDTTDGGIVVKRPLREVWRTVQGDKKSMDFWKFDKGQWKTVPRPVVDREMAELIKLAVAELLCCKPKDLPCACKPAGF